MPVFRLTPLDPSSLVWDPSSCCGVFLVRARDESTARRMAGEYRAFSPSHRTQTATPSANWSDPAIVSAEVVEGIADGDAVVLTFAGIRYRQAR